MVSLRRLTLLAVLLTASGCYVYEPVRPEDALLDARVRATVSARKAAELEPAMRNISTRLSGTLTERDGGGVLLEVPLYDATPGMSNAALTNRVYLPFEDLVTLESRTLSKWRTWTVVGAVVGGVVTSWAVVGGGKDTADKDKSGTDNAVVLRFPFRFGFW